MGEKSKELYCHFSFKRPKGESYGFFATAFYSDATFKNLILQKTRKIELWKNHQFITAIQSYENALSTIYEYQGKMRSVGVRQVMLVTDNSILAGWIENDKKNKQYTNYMRKAVKGYCVGGPKEITLGIGLMEVANYEKAYKFCNKEYLVEGTNSNNVVNNGEYKIQIGDYKSALDIIKEQ